MRGKRSKQYRKLMEQFSITFGFREPYQVIVDAEMVQDATRFKMDLAAGLQRTVHGKVKPMITQCEIRKLYERKNEPGVKEAIELAKTFERRRCGHHPDEYPKPLETIECTLSIVDPKSTGENKHRYVVASQSIDVRRMLREIRGVPLIYIKRSVMILEPMAEESVQIRAREERSKFRAELKKKIGKRKREDDEEDENIDKADGDEEEQGDVGKAAAGEKKTKKRKGPKGPNPLSMQKKKKDRPQDKPETKAMKEIGAATKEVEAPSEAKAKRKRRRKTKTDDGATVAEVSVAAASTTGEES